MAYLIESLIVGLIAAAFLRNCVWAREEEIVICRLEDVQPVPSPLWSRRRSFRERVVRALSPLALPAAYAVFWIAVGAGVMGAVLWSS